MLERPEQPGSRLRLTFLVEVVFHRVGELPDAGQGLTDLLDPDWHRVDDGRVALRTRKVDRAAVRGVEQDGGDGDEQKEGNVAGLERSHGCGSLTGVTDPATLMLLS